MTRHLLLATLLASGATFSLPAAALKGEQVDQCLELEAGHVLRRSGSQFLYVKNGADHYRVSFVSGQCGQLAVSSKFHVDTDGARDRICPEDTRVMTRGGSCAVGGIQRIEGDDYARLTRRR